MLNTNLSTRPFYNERGVHWVIAFTGVLSIAVMTGGIIRLVELSRANTALTIVSEQAERETAEMSTRISVLEQGLSEGEIETLRLAAEEANRLIDQRVFSWTEFFNVIERTIPSDVMLTTVRPDLRGREKRLELGVIGLEIADIDEFIERLEATNVFAGVLARQEELTNDGTYRAHLIGNLVSLHITAETSAVVVEGL